jgi:HlyD family secretion protein
MRVLNNKNMRKKRWWIIGATLLLVISLIVMKKNGVIGKEDALKVAVEEVKVRTIIETVSASGKVYPEDERKVSSDVSGEVVEMYVEEGDSVKRGQLVARVFADVLTSARDRASSVVSQQEAQSGNVEAIQEASRARLELARQNFERQKQLYADNVISKAEYEQAESQYLSAEADYKAAGQSVRSTKASVQGAQAGLSEANKNLDRTSIISPMDGIVSLLAVKKGERVAGNSFSLGTEMMRIADMSKIEVRVDVGENDIPKVKIGDSAHIEIDAYSGRKFTGIVTRISSSSTSALSAVPGTSADVTNYKVYIRIDSSSYSDLLQSNPLPFRPGMSASADIMTKKHIQVPSIPILSVTTRDKNEDLNKNKSSEKKDKKKQDGDEEIAPDMEDLEEVVFVVNTDGTVRKAVISTSIQDNEYIEVVGGLKIGDKVVSAPYNTISKILKNGDKVKVVSREDVYDQK